MKTFLLQIFLLMISLTIWAQLPSYYNGIDFSQPASNLEAALKNRITSTHNPLSYSQTYNWVKYIDEDVTNTNNVILIYNGVSESKNHTIGGGNIPVIYPEIWNREHVYPQSLITTTAVADLHHLRACDAVINNNRGNLPFASGSGNHGSVTGGYYPGDEWKGDVARMMMYMYLRYNEPFNDVGNLNLFLQWNVEDPVSGFEIQRNNRIQTAQGNRNPFIDQPYIATYLWGGDAAEDLWGWPNTITQNLNQNISITVFPNPFNNSISISGLPIGIETSISIKNTLGQVLWQTKQNTINELLIINEINALESNTNYFITITSEHFNTTKSIIKH